MRYPSGGRRGWATQQTESAVRLGVSAEVDSQEQPYADQYLAAVAAGNAPTVETFLTEVPEELREGVFVRIDRALANLQVEETAPREPQREVIVVDSPAAAAPAPEAQGSGETTQPRPPAPVVSVRRERAIRWLAMLAPAYMRHEFLGSLLALRSEMREKGVPRLRNLLATTRELARGAAQRAPLAWLPEKAVPAGADRLTAWARAAWRVSGPLLLAGYVVGALPIFLGGLAAVAFALGCVFRAVARPGWDDAPDDVRLVNSVLGSLVVVLAAALLLGVPAGTLLALASYFSVEWVAFVAVNTFVFGLLTLIAAVSGSGWVPEPWTSRHLVRVRMR